MPSFGQKLAKARKERKLSQYDLADKLNKTHTVVGKYERGDISPSIDIVYEIAKILDISVVYLLGTEKETDVFEDKNMIRRLLSVKKLNDNDSEHILRTLDSLLREAHARTAFEEVV